MWLELKANLLILLPLIIALLTSNVWFLVALPLSWFAANVMGGMLYLTTSSCLPEIQRTKSQVDNALTALLDTICGQVLLNARAINGECVEFELELKHMLRMLLLRIVNRIRENEKVIDVIAQDIIACTLKHFHNTYPRVSFTDRYSSDDQQCLDSASSVLSTMNQSSILSNLYRSNKLHPAMCSRAAEVSYLEKAFTTISHFDFPEDIRCSELTLALATEAFVLYFVQLSDVVSDPDGMNLMIGKILSGSKVVLTSTSDKVVPFLFRYCNSAESKSLPPLDRQLYGDPEMAQGVNAQVIMKDGLLFSLFMKFLHKEDAVHYIQCLGDLREIRQSRHFASKGSFENFAFKYFDCISNEKVLLSRDLISEFELLLRSFEIIPWSRKEKIILQIESEVHSILNDCYMERFKQTYDFTCRYFLDEKTAALLKHEGGFEERVSSSEFKRNSVDLDSLEVKLTDEEGSSENLSDEFVPASLTKVDIDLSNFRIELEPEVVELKGHSSSDSNLYYVIHVRRVALGMNNEEFHRSVYRRYENFSVLQDKLKFHYAKDLKDLKLPSRPNLVITTKAAHEQLRKIVPSLEQYLKALLGIPKFRHSAMLFDFLTKETSDDFESPNFLSKLALKRNGIADNIMTSIVKNEAGKALEVSYLPRFMGCMNGNPRNKNLIVDSASRKGTAVASNAQNAKSGAKVNSTLHNNALLDIIHVRGMTSATSEVTCIQNEMLQENPSNVVSVNSDSEGLSKRDSRDVSLVSIQRSVSTASHHKTSNKLSDVDLNSYYDYLLYFSIYIYSLSLVFQKILIGPIKSLLADFVNSCCAKFVKSKIRMGLHEEYLSQFLIFLTENLKPKSSLTVPKTPRSSQDKFRRKNRTLGLIRKALNPIVVKLIVGEQKHKETTEILFRLLQYSKLNKQLFYQILDRIIQRLYIEKSSSR
ncbi:uncharacterized protein LOC134842875 isoform X2 [Symsagittifera roscoffensis]|uniref:uncharacterized protein LOC134842875 isoform X2 n=1 Tax=Symsagittifera roscoffensis TaxID=84072 RepID=UPI00307C3BDD